MHLERIPGLFLPKDAVMSPEKNLAVTYVVPIRGEVKSGNFFHQVKDFARQQGVDPATYEIIYVRNNTRFDQVKPNGYSWENDRIHASIRYIQGKSAGMPRGLAEWEEKVLDIAKRKQLRIQSLHISPAEMEILGIHQNIEYSRAVGDNLAVSRYEEIGTDGAIVIMDADTRIQRDATKLITEQLVENPSVGLLQFPIDFIPGEGGERIFKTTAEGRFKYNARNLQSAVRGIHHAGWHAIKASALGEQIPQYADPSTRDRRAPKKGKTVYTSSIVMKTQDRARPAYVGGAFGAARYDFLYAKYASSTYEHPALSLLIDIYEKQRDNQVAKDTTQQLLSVYFGEKPWLPMLTEKIQQEKHIQLAGNWPEIRDTHKVSAKEYATIAQDMVRRLSGNSSDDFDAIVKKTVHAEALQHALVRKNIRQLVEHAYDVPLGKNITVADLQRTKGKQTAEATYLQWNEWVADKLQKLRTTYETPEEAYRSLQYEFPEQLQSFAETAFAYPNAVIMGIARFFSEVRLHPEAYPDVAPLLIVNKQMKPSLAA